jgi:murein L,D-transpeptidase YafK
MLTVAVHRHLIHSVPPRVGKSVLMAVLCGLIWSQGAFGSEPRYPVALMNWMVEGTYHALIVDKSQQRLMVWKVTEGEPAMIASFRCSTGENEGDKWVRGDMKTPEGVYFFCSVIDGRTLPAKYGLWAFTTDYPNFVDRRRGKSGDGIWLHGRDKPLGPKPDSNGCVALENQDLVKVSQFIKLQSTPLIVVKKLKLAPRSVIMEQERQLRDFVEGWRQAWESQDLDAYMGHYSPNFQSCWLDYHAWKEKKRRLNRRYKKIRVKLGNVYLYRQNGMVTALFDQEYRSDSYLSAGVKVLYLVGHEKYRIYAEDYHKPVDDTFPVGSLLARIDAPTGESNRNRQELRIRLVSTDEPEPASDGEFEIPRPSAPARGVVLKTIAAEGEISAPAIESNERFVHEVSPDRLIVARVMPASVTPESLATRADLSDVKPLRRRVPMRSESEQGHETGVSKAMVILKPEEFPAKPATSPEKPVEKPRLTREAQEPGPKSPIESDAVESPSLVKRFLSQWKTAWEQKDLDSYIKMYHADFVNGRMDFKEFVKTRKRYFRKYRTIRVKMDRLQIRKVEKQYQVKFLQIFRGDGYSDKGWKNMVLVEGEDKGLRILSEEWSAVQGPTRNSRTKGKKRGPLLSRADQ